MTTLDTIDNKISQIQKYLDRADGYKKYSREEIEKKDIVRDSLERVLFLVAQGTIDLGDMLIAYKQLRKPGNQGEVFQILKEKDIIQFDLMKKLIAMAGFRNVVIHDYAKIDYDKVYEVVHKNLKDIEDFIEIVKNIK